MKSGARQRLCLFQQFKKWKSECGLTVSEHIYVYSNVLSSSCWSSASSSSMRSIYSQILLRTSFSIPQPQTKAKLFRPIQGPYWSFKVFRYLKASLSHICWIVWGSRSTLANYCSSSAHSCEPKGSIWVLFLFKSSCSGKLFRDTCLGVV